MSIIKKQNHTKDECIEFFIKNNLGHRSFFKPFFENDKILIGESY